MTRSVPRFRMTPKICISYKLIQLQCLQIFIISLTQLTIWIASSIVTTLTLTLWLYNSLSIYKWTVIISLAWLWVVRLFTSIPFLTLPILHIPAFTGHMIIGLYTICQCIVIKTKIEWTNTIILTLKIVRTGFIKNFLLLTNFISCAISSYFTVLIGCTDWAYFLTSAGSTIAFIVVFYKNNYWNNPHRCHRILLELF